ncbi:MAG: hypothetical protein AAF902_03730 [Chloroflexota bacterium]
MIVDCTAGMSSPFSPSMKKAFVIVVMIALAFGCAPPEPTTGTGPGLGNRPTATPSRTPRPTRTPIPTATSIFPTNTPTITPTPTNTQEPTQTPTPTIPPPTATPFPTPSYDTLVYENELLQIKFEMPSNWKVDEDLDVSGILQIADSAETFFSGSTRRGALITISGIPEVSASLTEWVTVVTSTFNENYLLDGQTSLTTPININNYEGLRVEQRGSYTIVDPPEPIVLKIVAFRHNGWLVTVAAGSRADQFDEVNEPFEQLIQTLEITAVDTSSDSD